MIASQSLLSLASLAWVATPITIAQVTSARDGGRLIIDIAADTTVDPEAASAKIDGGRIYLFVGDTRVKADNRSWGEGEAAIRAHRHKHQVELVIPQSEDACQGPVEFVKATGGLRAIVGCEAAFAGSRPTGHAVRASARTKAQPVPQGFAKPILTASAGSPAEPPPAAQKSDPSRDSRELKDVLRLDERAPASEEEAPAPKAVAPIVAAAPPTPPTKPAVPSPPALVTVPVAEKPVAAEVSPLLAIGVAAPAPSESPAAKAGSGTSESVSRGGSGGGVGVFLAGSLLLALAGGAYFFARKRAALPRFVRIVETASLGPKRSIVVAQIGDETLILGSSEAGITVLQSRTESPSAAASVLGEAPTGAAGSLTVELASDAAIADEFDFPESSTTGQTTADIPEADFAEDPLMPVQGGLLARLFRRSKPANESEFHNFEQLLEDSVEDQELRQKLSLGMAGRVP